MARRAVSRILPDFRLRMAVRTDTHFRCRLKVYDETIKVFKSAVRKARLGRDEELGALRGWTSRPGSSNGSPTVLVEQTHGWKSLSRSHSYGGRSVFGWESPPADPSDSVEAMPQFSLPSG